MSIAMNSRAPAILALLILCDCHSFSAPRNAIPMSASTKTFQSPNGKFTLTLDQSLTPASPFSLATKSSGTVSANTAVATEPTWSTSITTGPLQNLRPGDIYISDDGDFFITINDWNNSQLVLHRKGLDEWILKPERHFKSYFQSLPGWIYRIDRINGERVAGLWIRDENNWIAYKISDKSTVSVSPEIKQKWTDETRREILDKLERARQADLTRKIKNLPEPIVRLAQKTLPSADYGELREIDYEFLTLLQNPGDRRWIERLMEPRELNERKFTDIYYLCPSFAAWNDPPNYLEVAQQERLIGDWLLRVWDHKIQKGDDYTLDHGDRQASVRTPKYLLGRIEGVARLPTPFAPFSRRGDVVRFLLIPRGVRGPTETDFREREDFTGNYLQTKRTPEPKPVLDIPFTFNSVIPGEYQFKVIWDKRPRSPTPTMQAPAITKANFPQHSKSRPAKPSPITLSNAQTESKEPTPTTKPTKCASASCSNRNLKRRMRPGFQFFRPILRLPADVPG